jgi:hypothetical protein
MDVRVPPSAVGIVCYFNDTDHSETEVFFARLPRFPRGQLLPSGPNHVQRGFKIHAAIVTESERHEINTNFLGLCCVNHFQ